ncbi:hypothetical protein [Methanomethylophilus alvi]|uniref:hypothetical protein n=1 Tax=Methanomethylophilus alvi TaxID=1291540 RepID=UPI0037DD8E49
MDEYTALRCPSCGASDLEEADNGMIRCVYCGSVQAKVDAQKYIDQAKSELIAFISKAIPAGVSMSQTETMDPVARHNIFVQNIKPTIDSLYREFRFGFISAVNQQLIALPFRTLTRSGSKYNSKQLYEFDAKVQSVKPLAVDDAGKQLLSTASGVAISYASLLNNIKLIAENAPDRYEFMVNNFRVSADSLRELSGYEVVVKRYDALAIACEGFNDLMLGKAQDAKTKLQNAEGMLEEAKAEASKSLDYGAMTSSINKEIVVVKTGAMIADALSIAPDLDSSAALEMVKEFTDEINAQEARFSSFGGQWTTLIKRADRFSDIFSEFTNVLKAKTGEEAICIAKGSGDYYIPMWVVDLKYSFITGSLFKKKAVQVTETVLVSAMFTSYNETFMHPNQAITDIFANMPESSFMSRVKGTESSITMGGCLKAIVDQSAVGPVSSAANIVVPVSTKPEAELLCKEYVEGCKQRYPKLTMGNPIAQKLIYIPCSIGDNVKPNVDMQSMVPKCFGSLDIIKKLSI